MAGLLSLPNEVLIHILSASLTTRTLCDLAHINKRFRAIWIKNSKQIITDVYNPRISHLMDAVNLTLAGARQVATVPTDAVPPEAQPQCRYLAHILRNVDLAVNTCDQFTEFRKSLPPDDAWYAEPTTSLHGAYFIIRRAVMGYNLPELRPRLRSELRSLQSNILETSKRLLDYFRNFAPRILRCELECALTEEEMEHVPIDDRMTRLPLDWRHAAIMLGLALQGKKNGVMGILEDVWTAPPVNEEDLEYSSNSDIYSLEYRDSEEE